MSFIPASGGWIQNVLGAMGDNYGFRTTSTLRSPQQNAAVGGVPNSQHVSGTARDWSIKGKDPKQINSFLEALRGAGFEAFVHDAGSGQHIHSELPPEGESAITCPSWLPENLCGGYAAISGGLGKIGPNLPGTLARSVGMDDLADTLDDWLWRIALILFALILVAVGIYFIAKGPAEKVAKTATKLIPLSKLFG